MNREEKLKIRDEIEERLRNGDASDFVEYMYDADLRERFGAVLELWFQKRGDPESLTEGLGKLIEDTITYERTFTL